MKIRYQIETCDQGVWSPAYCAMADSYAIMAQRLGGEAGSPRLKTQYAILTGEDERRMPKEYIVRDAGFNAAHNIHFDGMVTVNTESGTALVPYLRSEADCYRTGADDGALCTKPLEILRELEAYRIKQAGKDNPSDFAIRVCEAIVARAGGFTGRSQWEGILTQGEEPGRSGYEPHLLSTLRELEAFRKGPGSGADPHWAIEKCQEITAMVGFGNPITWRDILRGEKFENMERLFDFAWTKGSVNDNIIGWCRENGVDYRYDHAFRLQINPEGSWRRCDYRTGDGRTTIYTIPDDMKQYDAVHEQQSLGMGM